MVKVVVVFLLEEPAKILSLKNVDEIKALDCNAEM